MRIFNVLKNTSIENLRHIFPPSNKMTLSTKMSPPPIPLQNHFLFSPRRPSAQNPQAESLIKYQKETQSHKRHTKSKQKSNSNTSNHKNQKQTPQKDNPKQSIKLHQLENTPTQTAIQIQQTPSPIPLRNHTPQKRKDVPPQTQVHFTPNAEEFAPKHFAVSSKTQGRLTTNASPFSAPKSPDNSPSYL